MDSGLAPLLRLQVAERIDAGAASQVANLALGDIRLWFSLRGVYESCAKASIDVAGQLKDSLKAIGRPWCPAGPGGYGACDLEFSSSSGFLYAGMPERDFGWYVTIPWEFADETNLAFFWHDLARRAGLRPTVFGALNFMAAPALAVAKLDQLDRKRPDLALAAIGVIQTTWGHDIDRVLDLDVAAGTARHPGLVRELNVERRPLEFAILRTMLVKGSSVRGAQVPLNGYTRPSLRRVADPELIAAGAALVADGWLGSFVRHATGPYFVATRGEKLRKLTSYDVLTI
jgi:hypothetical protein